MRCRISEIMIFSRFLYIPHQPSPISRKYFWENSENFKHPSELRNLSCHKKSTKGSTRYEVISTFHWLFGYNTKNVSVFWVGESQQRKSSKATKVQQNKVDFFSIQILLIYVYVNFNVNFRTHIKN